MTDHLPVEQSNQDRPCPFCGETHPVSAVGIAGGPFAGIEFRACPNIPEGFVYNDHEYESGPRGQMFRIERDDA